MKMILILAFAASLSACATNSAPNPNGPGRPSENPRPVVDGK